MKEGGTRRSHTSTGYSSSQLHYVTARKKNYQSTQPGILKPACEVNYNILKLSSVVEICNSGKSNLKLRHFSVEYSGSDVNLFVLRGK